MDFRNLLSRLLRNRNKDDLHSAVCRFKSGRTAYICARYDKSFTVILRDEDLQVDCSDVSEVLRVFGEDELVDYEI